MSRAKTTKLYRTFVRGLITEAGLLTYPEDSSTDELNTVLFRKGNRTRRLGFDYESGSTSFSLDTDDHATRTNEFSWNNVGNKANTNFLVVQTGRRISFFDTSKTPLSSGKFSFTIDLYDFRSPTATLDLIRTNYAQFSAGRGYLFVAHPFCDPFMVEYDEEEGTFTSTKINIQIRDFVGLDDQLAPDEEPKTLTKEHHYNLKNQGWVSPNNEGASWADYYNPKLGEWVPYMTGSSINPISQYFSKVGRYPGNNKQWWVAKADSDDDEKGIKQGDFLPELLTKFFTGSGRAPRGHYIVNAFHIDRTAVSGIANIPVEVVQERPTSVAFFSGRAFWGCNSTVYFSQIMDAKHKAGLCYQEADPTSEDISDLVATDGGVIEIPEAQRIVRLEAIGQGVMVIATNGVWYVYGGDGGAFKATDIAQEKVNPIGCKCPLSVVQTDSNIFWWSEAGIMTASPASSAFGIINGKFEQTNLTEQTIQTFFLDIPDVIKEQAKGVYDPRNNTILWLYRDHEVQANYYNRILIFDISLGAFYPWKVSSNDISPRIRGLFLGQTVEQLNYDDPVTVDGVPVTSNGVPVTVGSFNTDIRPTAVKYLASSFNSDDFRFGSFTNRNFVDWEAWNGSGLEYDSYVETGYELFGDAMRKKSVPYIVTFMRRTESSYDFDPVTDDIRFDDPSSCFMVVKWDWTNSQAASKWTTPVQIYRPTRVKFFDYPAGQVDSGYPVVITKNKVRGQGRALQFRFGTNERGKNFDLLGWSISVQGNSEV